MTAAAKPERLSTGATPHVSVLRPSVVERLAALPFAQIAALYSIGIILALLIFKLWTGGDYVGPDNDDRMRLVEVRDLLAGQGWFDNIQHRMGLAGGTPMHWSRFIDLPIAVLIRLFSLVLTADRAEEAALTVWPLLTTIPVVFGTALSCLRVGGRPAMHIGLGLVTLFLLSCLKFRPGAIDHHNVQVALVAIMVAMLLDRERRAASFAVAGAMVAMAIAIGAETTPLIAVASLVVALQWVWHGIAARKPTLAFSLALAITVSAAFFLTIPPARYTQVACDSISFAFYTLALVGAAGLFLAALAVSNRSRPVRLAAIVLCGAAVGVSAFVFAPACLQNPLSGLDPLLVELWLNAIGEALSVVGVMHLDTGELGFNYAVGTLAIVVCIVAAVRGREREAHFVILSLLSISLAIGLYQVRGTLYSNYLAMIPLAAAISLAQRKARAQPEKVLPGLSFAVLTLASVPSLWMLAALLVPSHLRNIALDRAGNPGWAVSSCVSLADILPLASEPVGVVAAPSELGTPILRYTKHRVLAAPYHRNQAGMLAELHLGLAEPLQAMRMLDDLGVTILAFCADDPQTERIVARAPQGFYAGLARNTVPPGLAEFAQQGASGMRLFHVKSTISP